MSRLKKLIESLDDYGLRIGDHVVIRSTELFGETGKVVDYDAEKDTALVEYGQEGETKDIPADQLEYLD
jgi:ribosomal protein L24